MGLGKTLQVLMFLASIIESGDISDNKNDLDLPPWKPILIVAPVILIENATWESDMRSFFSSEGAVFEPLLVLHGATIKQFRSPDIQGREINLGQAALRLDALRKFKIILTNYETVVNYQHSFAQIPWSAVVTDEAQEYKTPSTKVSHALKALNARFRIACTGTPVETRLFAGAAAGERHRFQGKLRVFRARQQPAEAKGAVETRCTGRISVET
jgi:SNF2 family DNA or RNA helicase